LWHPERMLSRAVTVSLGPTDFPTVITIRDHVLRADEPSSKGGTDTGPEPMELLLASLGACTAITLRMYAGRKRWPLTGVRVQAGFDSEQGTRLVRMLLSCEGDGLDDDQRARLLQIANACPVHKLLAGGVMVDTRLDTDPAPGAPGGDA
jgi:putative redox protein